jgi:uncharacterized protein (TIGR02996 family)
MAVYFVYRCPGISPTEKYVRRFDDDNVLDWFRSRWARLAGSDRTAAYRRLKRDLGCPCDELADVFCSEDEEARTPPASLAELLERIEDTNPNEVACQSKHCLQVFTWIDEPETAYYLFDDHYLRKHRDRAAFLLHEGWQLPDASKNGSFRPKEETEQLMARPGGVGATYLVFLVCESKSNMDDLSPAHRIDGVRLPELAGFLMANPPPRYWTGLLSRLRAVLSVPPRAASAAETAFHEELLSRPDDRATWAAYSDWLVDQGRGPAGTEMLRRALERIGKVTEREADGFQLGAAAKHPTPASQPAAQAFVRLADRRRRSPSLVHVGEHLAQMCLCADYVRRARPKDFDQWIFFDDLWAAAQPALANALLRFRARWDVLTV